MNLRVPVLVILASLACVLTAQEGMTPKPRPSSPQSPKKKTTKKTGKTIDLNSAPKAELMRLPGVDEAMAGKIVAGRPYRSKYELVTRGIMPRGALQAIKKQISAHQTAVTK
jgi:DNA uptake protein ComE-like DNA-binding protein